MATKKSPPQTKARPKPSPAHAFAAGLGMKPPPAVVKFTLSFRAPRQGSYQPPHYELVIDSTQANWCTYRNYNAAPRPIDPRTVQVPVEMTSFVLLAPSKGVQRSKVGAWAKSLLTRAD